MSNNNTNIEKYLLLSKLSYKKELNHFTVIINNDNIDDILTLTKMLHDNIIWYQKYNDVVNFKLENNVEIPENVKPIETPKDVKTIETPKDVKTNKIDISNVINLIANELYTINGKYQKFILIKISNIIVVKKSDKTNIGNISIYHDGVYKVVLSNLTRKNKQISNIYLTFPTIETINFEMIYLVLLMVNNRKIVVIDENNFKTITKNNDEDIHVISDFKRVVPNNWTWKYGTWQRMYNFQDLIDQV